MTDIQLNITNIDHESVTLNFNSDEEVKILTASDVDLTALIKKLTYLIEKKCEIVFNKHTVDDPKQKLILDTIENIVASFNESIADVG